MAFGHNTILSLFLCSGAPNDNFCKISVRKTLGAPVSFKQDLHADILREMENAKHVKLVQFFVSVVFGEFTQNLNSFLRRNRAWKRAERK